MDKKKILALIIWWCEGTKARRDFRWKNAYLYPIEVINTDYRIIKIFLDYLHHDLGISLNKFRGQLQIHENDDKDAIELFWSKKLNLPLSQLNKTIVRKVGNKPGKNKGTFKLRLYDKILYNKLLSSLNEILYEYNFGD